MNAPQSTSPRRRLQELLAIPDNQRTDEEWDELNELEISLAPGNREGAPDPNLRRPTPSTGIGGKPPRPQKQPGQFKQGGQKPGGQKGGGQKGGGQQKPSQPRPQGQGQVQPQVQVQAQPQPTAPASAESVPKAEDGQAAKKPARKFRKRGPRKTDGNGASAGGGEGGGEASSGGDAQ